MKCIQRVREHEMPIDHVMPIMRVTEEYAQAMMVTGDYKYVSKSAYRAYARAARAIEVLLDDIHGKEETQA